MAYYSVVEIMNVGTLAAASTIPTTITGTECEVIDLTECRQLALTFEAQFDASATEAADHDVVAHIRTSPYGGSTVANEWDTVDYTSATIPCTPGSRVQITKAIVPDPKYMKVLMENTDASHAVTNVKITKVTSGFG